MGLSPQKQSALQIEPNSDKIDFLNIRAEDLSFQMKLIIFSQVGNSSYPEL